MILKVCFGFVYKKMVFYFLNFFNLKGYDKYFYIDSDVFFYGSIEEFIKMKYGLMCCKDFVVYKGFVKDGDIFELVRDMDWGGNLWFCIFNVGIFFFDKVLVNVEVYKFLLDFFDLVFY